MSAAPAVNADLSTRDLPPNIFAMVMATGIVSLAAHFSGMDFIAYALFWYNVALYPVLWVLLLTRCLRHGGRVGDDLQNHARAPGFFAAVAGTCILGNQCVVLYDAAWVGLGLWIVGVLLWVGLTYTMLPILLEAKTKPSLEHGVNGGWLLVVVSTQAVCVLGCLLADVVTAYAVDPLLFALLCFWLLGGMLYGWLIALIYYRCIFMPLPARELTPAYWINMGAMAISTLAGVSLVREAGRLPLLTELVPFLKGVTLLFWATATWWIPMLLALGAWRHIRQRFPLVYEHSYWAAVFPIGMYTVCTQRLARQFRLPFLAVIPQWFVWAALGVWSWAFFGLVLYLFRSIFRGPRFIRPIAAAAKS
jgi:tellurite resistance protein TehA-like permease